jgi:hypothetical protein
LEGQLSSIGSIWQEADRLPTRQSMEALQQTLQALGALQIKWNKLKEDIGQIK